MSSPVAGKFQDHYEVLGVDPRAESDVIQKAYAKLAQKYHPSNQDTGDAEKFEAVNLAFEVLADPILRPEFDKIKGLDKEQGPPKFSGTDFFEALGRETGLRQALLCVLYDRRRLRPFTPSLSMRNLESTLIATAEELNFVMWFLKQKGHMASDDKSSLQITVAGMDFLEKNQPSPEVVMPFIKETALTKPWVRTLQQAAAEPSQGSASASAVPTSAVPTSAVPTSAVPTSVVPTSEEPPAHPVGEIAEQPSSRAGQSVMSVLNRALSRAEFAVDDGTPEKLTPAEKN